MNDFIVFLDQKKSKKRCFSQKKHEIVQFFPYISSKNTVLKSFFPQMKFKSNLELVYMIFYGKRNHNF